MDLARPCHQPPAFSSVDFSRGVCSFPESLKTRLNSTELGWAPSGLRCCPLLPSRVASVKKRNVSGAAGLADEAVGVSQHGGVWEPRHRSGHTGP